jgi:cell division protein FtsB
MRFFSNLSISTRDRLQSLGLGGLTSSHLLGLLLAALIVLSQYPLWLGKGGWFKAWELERNVKAARVESDKLRVRNEALAEEVRDLRTGHGALEERARVELGMLKGNETFYRIVDKVPAKGAQGTNAAPATPFAASNIAATPSVAAR